MLSSSLRKCLNAANGSAHALVISEGVRSTVAPNAAHRDARLTAPPAFRNEEHDFVSTIDANKGKTDAGIARCGFNNGRTGLEQAAGLRIEDHAESGAVLDAASGVEEFELVNASAIWTLARRRRCSTGVCPISSTMLSAIRRERVGCSVVDSVANKTARV